MTLGPRHGCYLLLRTDRIPGEQPLPYVKAGRKTLIAGLVTFFHAAMIIVPMIWLAVSERIRPPVYVMRLPTVDSVPNDNPGKFPNPSPQNQKPKGTPDKGKPLSEIPEIPDLVKPAEPPKPAPPDPPKPQPKEIPKKQPAKKTAQVQPKPVQDRRKTVPADVTPKPKKNTLLSASEIKISKKRVKNPGRTSSEQQNQTSAEERARRARNAEVARTLRSLTGEIGGKGVPGGGSGPKGIESKEVNDYYSKVETFLKRRWEQPSIYGSQRPKVIILLHVAADGRIVSASIRERSGNTAMDASVERLIRDLRALPAPPRSMTFTVTMEMDR